MERLLKRRDFLKVQKGRRVHTGLFSVQALKRDDETQSRCGFTISKKVDQSAVIRNRIRRRLKEAMRLDPQATGLQSGIATGIDFVLVAKRESLQAPFALIQSELVRALSKAQKALTDHHAQSGVQSGTVVRPQI